MRKIAFAAGAPAWFGIVLASASCGTTPDSRFVETKFARTSFCPEDRVHATPVPELAMVPPPEAIARVTPWEEPAPPPGVAEDPERARLWQAKRDADFRDWSRTNTLSDPKTSPTFAFYRAMPVYEVSGCGSTRLYACQNASTNAGHYKTRGRSCLPVEEIWWDVRPAHVVCANGGVMRARATTGESTPSVTCSAEEGAGHDADFDLAAHRCAEACPEKRASNAARCRLACATSARETCEAQGLDTVGLCERYASTERELRAAAEAATASETRSRAIVNAAEELKAIAADEQTCTTSCRVELRSCILACVTTAREHCERIAPTTVWCKGFRAQEEVVSRSKSP